MLLVKQMESKCHLTKTKSWGAWFESVLDHAEYYLLFEGFIKELDRGQSFSCSSLLRLEEMYSEHSFMKKLGAHLSFLKVKSPTIKIFMDFSQQKVPHITEAHNNMESSLYYLEKNTHLSEEDLTFCFEERKELVLFCRSFQGFGIRTKQCVITQKTTVVTV